jgi:CxxC-x17-CxxC domain-containing protein
MELVDREIVCLDCGQPFVFTAGEQEFFGKKGFREEPKRCKPCRDTRKTRRTDQLTGQLTGGLERGNGNGNTSVAHLDDDIGNRMPAPRRGAPPPRTAARPSPARARTDRETFDAVCAQCGTATRVPFRVVAGRPVYCRDCYGARVGG